MSQSHNFNHDNHKNSSYLLNLKLPNNDSNYFIFVIYDRLSINLKLITIMKKN